MFYMVSNLIVLMQFGRNNYFFGNSIQRNGCSYCRCTKISFKLSALGFGSNALATDFLIFAILNSFPVLKKQDSSICYVLEKY